MSMNHTFGQGVAEDDLRFGRTLRMTRREVLALMGMGALAAGTSLWLPGRRAYADDGGTWPSWLGEKPEREQDVPVIGNAVADPNATPITVGEVASNVLYAAAQTDLSRGESLWGYVDKTGSWVIKPQFAALGSEPMEAVTLCLGPNQGAQLSQRYADALVMVPGVFTGDLMPAQQGVSDGSSSDEGLWGYIDRSGNWAIKPQYQEAALFNEGLALVLDTEDALHYIKPDGSDAFGALDCSDATCFCQGRAFLLGTHQGDAWGEIDTTGAWAHQSAEDPSLPYCYRIPLLYTADGLARLGKQYLDVDENPVVDFSEIYPDTFHTDNDFAGCDYHGGRLSFDGFIFDTTPAVTCPTRIGSSLYDIEHQNHTYQKTTYFKDGGLSAQDTALELWGYTDPNGAWIIPPRFSWALPFSEGKACVMDLVTGDAGWIDTTGAWAIPPHFAMSDETTSVPLCACFVGGCAFAEISTEEGAYDGWIDETGEWIVKWDAISRAGTSALDGEGEGTPAWQDNLPSLAATYREAGSDGSEGTVIEIQGVGADGTTNAHVTFQPDDANGRIECDVAGTLASCPSPSGTPRLVGMLYGAGENGTQMAVGLLFGAPGAISVSVDGAEGLRYHIASCAMATDYNGAPEELSTFEGTGDLESVVARTPTK